MFKKILISFIAIIVASPVIIVTLSWFLPNLELWHYFGQTLLPQLLSNTLILLLGVGIGVGVLGTLLAWLVVMIEFPGRHYFEWALLLPFAIPTYVLGFVYLGIFDYHSDLQTFLQSVVGIDGVDIRQGYLPIIAIFTLVFYPYVYLISRAAFKQQQANLFASARLLGAKPYQVFFLMSLPLAYPAIGAGILVTMMETLADFGLVSLFNYDTFTTAIYSAWGDFRSIEVAAQLASILVIIAMLLIYLEYLGRKKTKYHSTEIIKHRPYRLTGISGYLLSSFMLIIILLSFVIPVIQMIIWIINSPDDLLNLSNYLQPLANSLILAFIASLIIIILALILILNHSQTTPKYLVFFTKLATLGYAIPGSVLAVGVLYGVYQLSQLSELLFNISLTQYLFGSIALLIFAYASRFLAVAYQSIHANFLQIKPNIISSARLLAVSSFWQTLLIKIPLLKPGIIAAILLIFIDIIKELPATYILRPFGWDTLAIKVYEYSTEALYGQAAIPALIMVFLATILILIFQRFDKRMPLH